MDEIKLKKWLSAIESIDMPANVNLKIEMPSAVGHATSAYMHNFLIAQMLRIQGIDKTIEDIKKSAMPSSKLPNKEDDMMYQVTWKGLLDLHKVVTNEI